MQTLDYPSCHRPMTEPAPNSDLFKRADSLESLFGHLEKTTENLDHVIGDGQQQFEEVGAAAHGQHQSYGHAVAVGDFDADGFPDLYLTNFGANTLLHNNGDGTFDDVTDTAGVGDPLWGFGGIWFDIDGDRDLDLYVVNYIDWSFQKSKTCEVNGRPVFCGPGEFAGLPDRLFTNLGNGQFSESADSFGFAGTSGKGLVALAADLDHDLQVELYVGNDLSPNLLYTRSRPPFLLQETTSAATPFLEIAAAAGAAVDDQGYVEASMGIACGDFDRDGWSDLFLTHFYNHKNTLYRNHGQLRFQDVSKGTRIAQHTQPTTTQPDRPTASLTSRSATIPIQRNTSVGNPGVSRRRVARGAPDPLGLFLATGLTTAVVLGGFVNAMVTCGLLPVTGLAMPFVSYGGTSMLATGAMVGILLNVSRHAKPSS